jgi:hypothetical protein
VIRARPTRASDTTDRPIDLFEVERMMDKHYAYCSGCDRQVEIIVEHGAGPPDPYTGAATDRIVCLEHGDSCTGSLCPLDARPADTRKLQ